MKGKIVLSLVPLFALGGCAPDNSNTGVASQDSYSQVDENGFYSNNEIQQSYDKARESGYTGSMDDWVKLIELSDSNPSQAAQQAADSGFSGGEMLLGALTGAALGAVMANASNSRQNMASNSYSAQRLNDNNNYAECRTVNGKKDPDCDKRSGNGYYRSSGTTSTTTYSSMNNNKNSYSRSTTTARPTTTARSSVSTVSRGGFGGAVSSGG